MTRDSSLPIDLRGWTKTLVARYNLRAGERLGQHFLVDRRVLNAIVEASAPQPRVPVLEVGGGLGVLTLALLEAGAQVVSVEFDPRLAEGLERLAQAGSNLTVIKRDILKLSDIELQAALGSATFDIAANLPYEISGAFLRRFTDGAFLPRRMTLLLQLEVAQRIAAKPGDMSLLALTCQYYGKVQVLRSVPPNVFWPAPRVTSALVQLVAHTSNDFSYGLQDKEFVVLWRIARIGFAARRKRLIHNLIAGLKLPGATILSACEKVGLSNNARAQELSPQEWAALTKALLPLLQ